MKTFLKIAGLLLAVWVVWHIWPLLAVPIAVTLGAVLAVGGLVLAGLTLVAAVVVVLLAALLMAATAIIGATAPLWMPVLVVIGLIALGRHFWGNPRSAARKQS